MEVLFTDLTWFTSPPDRLAANRTHPLTVIPVLRVPEDLRQFQHPGVVAEGGDDRNNFTIFVVPKFKLSVLAHTPPFTPYFLKELRCDAWSGMYAA